MNPALLRARICGKNPIFWGAQKWTARMDGISVLRAYFPQKWKREKEVPQFYMKTAYTVFNAVSLHCQRLISGGHENRIRNFQLSSL